MASANAWTSHGTRFTPRKLETCTTDTGRSFSEQPAPGAVHTTQDAELLHLHGRVAHTEPCRAGAGVGVDDREVDLVVGGVEIEEELVGLVDDLVDPGVGAVGKVYTVKA